MDKPLLEFASKFKNPNVISYRFAEKPIPFEIVTGQWDDLYISQVPAALQKCVAEEVADGAQITLVRDFSCETPIHGIFQRKKSTEIIQHLLNMENGGIIEFSSKAEDNYKCDADKPRSTIPRSKRKKLFLSSFSVEQISDALLKLPSAKRTDILSRI